MISLVYVSSAVRLFTEAELVALLAAARKKNAQLGITGLLLYQDGNFMQALEGDEVQVHALYDAIKMDEHHRGVLTLLERPISQREFSGWHMGFQDLNDPEVRALEGFSDCFDSPFNPHTLATNRSQAKRLLNVFHRMHERLLK